MNRKDFDNLRIIVTNKTQNDFTKMLRIGYTDVGDIHLSQSCRQHILSPKSFTDIDAYSLNHIIWSISYGPYYIVIGYKTLVSLTGL